jgi:hypothetical protein
MKAGGVLKNGVITETKGMFFVGTFHLYGKKFRNLSTSLATMLRCRRQLLECFRIVPAYPKRRFLKIQIGARG